VAAEAAEAADKGDIRAALAAPRPGGRSGFRPLADSSSASNYGHVSRVARLDMPSA
jgi:hypothetical protein